MLPGQQPLEQAPPALSLRGHSRALHLQVMSCSHLTVGTRSRVAAAPAELARGAERVL